MSLSKPCLIMLHSQLGPPPSWAIWLSFQGNVSVSPHPGRHLGPHKFIWGKGRPGRWEGWGWVQECSHRASRGTLLKALGKHAGTSGVQKSRKRGEEPEDEYSIISNTKNGAKRSLDLGTGVWQRRPPAGANEAFVVQGVANATKKMCLGSADVPGPPEQNNDIITISVTDQTVHKVTGEGSCNTHTGGGALRLRPEARDAGTTACPPLSIAVSLPR